MAKTVGKGDIAEMFSKEMGLSKSEGMRALNSLIFLITTNLKKGNKVTLTGFGTFDVVKRKARKGVNPQTGEKIKIAARKAPTFKAGAALKEAVSKK